MIDELVAKADLEIRTEALAEQITRLSPLSIRAAKLTVESLARDKLTVEADAAAADCYESSDFREGIQGFLHKRQPTFEGR